MVYLRPILEYLSGSVQIRTETFFRNFNYEACVSCRALYIQLISISKLFFSLFIFRKILENRSGSVKICTDSQGVLNMGTHNHDIKPITTDGTLPTRAGQKENRQNGQIPFRD